MGKKTKYFMLNNGMQFQRCLLQNLSFDRGRLRPGSTEEGHSVLLSRVFDSGQTDMEWHQWLCTMDNEGNVAYTVYIYTANNLMRVIDGREESTEEVLFDKTVDWEKKKEIFEPYMQKKAERIEDILLHEVSGRYLWFAMEIYEQPGQHLGIEKIKISFPRQSWISYLPEIYQSTDKNMFYERFLAVYQTMYEELNDVIRNMPSFLDIDGAEGHYLKWLGKWLDINEGYMWSEDQLRELLKKARYIYKYRGTPNAILELARLYTGNKDVYLVENHRERDCETEESSRDYENLYGTDSFRFQVLVKEEFIPSTREYKTLTRILEEVKPAHMEMQLIPLRPYMFLGNHVYLGINSCLGEYRESALDGKAKVSLTLLGDGKQI